MKIAYELSGPDKKTDRDANRKVLDALNALPIGLQHACYGSGFKRSGMKVKRVARQLCPPGPPEGLVSRKGRTRLHLRDSIRVVLVGWRWRGAKVPRSAVVVVAQQPHAHLIERGTKRWKKGPRPFLMPAMESSNLLEEFRAGAARQFGVVVKQIRERKLNRKTAAALRLKESDVDL